MLYFLDSADFSAIETTRNRYPIDGVTTNPTILARDLPRDCTLSEGLQTIRRLTEGLLLFCQVTASPSDEMCREAQKICRLLGGKLSIKLPATTEGFAAAKQLSSEGISVTMTAVYSISQALLAGKCGATFVAPYLSHLDNLSQDGAAVAAEMASSLAFHQMPTQVLAASFRTAAQVERCITGGVSAVTVTAEMLDILATHPGTLTEVASFSQKWGARFSGGIGELL